MGDADTDVRPPYVNTDELSTLRMFLAYLRETIIRKAEGVSEEDAHRPGIGVGSGTSLAWLLAHLADAELNWFEWFYTGTAELREEVDAGRTVPELIAAYRAATARVDAIIDAYPDLERQGVQTWEGLEAPPTLRWILVHTIEETARHAGHADILREQIDGATGR